MDPRRIISPASTDFSAAGDYFMDTRLEHDITAQLSSQDYDIPPRPTSRLGFHCVGDSDAHEKVHTSTTRLPMSNTIEWTRSLFQGISIGSSATDADTDMDITSASHHPDVVPAAVSLSTIKRIWCTDDTPSHAGSGAEEDCTSSDTTSDDSDDSSYGDMDLGSVPHDMLLFPPPPLSPIPFPIISSGSALMSDSIDDELPQKFNCLPSPLSSDIFENPVGFRHNLAPSRHNYHHHGFSRHALMYIKWFWATREDNWQERDLQMEAEKAYDGIALSHEAQKLGGASFGKGLRKHSTRLPPLSIHPRRGDISGLRDPYCAHIDRCFADLPLWTMAKTLWMFDVQMGMERKSTEESGYESSSLDADEEDCSYGFEHRALSTSTGFSDDSDVTLVDSDNELDDDPAGIIVGQQGCSSDSPSSSTSAQQQGKDSYPGKAGSEAKASSSPPTPQYAKHPPYLSPCLSSKFLSCRAGWETNWYKRWELLIEIVRLDRERQAWRASVSQPTCSSSPAKDKLCGRFFIGETDGQTEEDEQAQILLNPLYSTSRTRDGPRV